MRRALVVTRDLELGSTWMAWLRAAGYATGGCVGPDLTFACPRRRGTPCPQRDAADVVVVDRSSDHAGLCAAGAGDTTVEGPDEPWASDRRAFVARVSAAASPRPIRIPTSPGPGDLDRGGGRHAVA